MNAALLRTPLRDVGDLFRQHLDLSPLRGRGRGTVRCPFHGEDKHPSLSLDLDRGLFHCFSCGVGGGIKRFSELVGATPARPWRSPRESEWSRARREALRREQALAERRREWLPLWLASDHLRACARAAATARGIAAHLGSDDPRTWPLLERAARVEIEGLAAEAELDALMAEGRIA